MSLESLKCELELQKELEDDATSKLRVPESHEKDKNDNDESLKLIGSSFLVGSIENVEIHNLEATN